MKKVEFIKDNGAVFCTTEDADAAVFLWKMGFWDCVVNGNRYPKHNWRGRVAIEQCFGIKIIPL